MIDIFLYLIGIILIGVALWLAWTQVWTQRDEHSGEECPTPPPKIKSNIPIPTISKEETTSKETTSENFVCLVCEKEFDNDTSLAGHITGSKNEAHKKYKAKNKKSNVRCFVLKKLT